MQGIDNEEFQSLILSVGTHRSERALSPVEVAGLLKRGVGAGATRRQLGDELGVGPSQIATFLRLLDVAPEVRHLSTWGADPGGIPFSTVAQLSRLPVEEHEAVGMAILEHQLTWKEVVQLVQISARTGDTIATVIEKVLTLRPEVETRHLLVGSIVDVETQRRLELMSQAARDALLSESIKRVNEDFDGALRLGTRRFTIVSPDDPTAMLGVSADELERIVAEDLSTQLS